MTENNQKNDQQVYNDEIDLFDLIKKIWKWKWFTIALVVIITGAVFINEKRKPDFYTAKAHIKIGQLAGKEIEGDNEVAEFLIESLRKRYQNDKTSREVLNDVVASKGGFSATTGDGLSIKMSRSNGIAVISVTSKEGEEKEGHRLLTALADKLVRYHGKIFKDALPKIQRNIRSSENENLIHPVYRLSTYNFPTKVLGKILVPEKPDARKTKMKLAVAFMGAVFLGIFLSLFIDYLLAEIKQRR